MDILALVAGLALFLLGMNSMGEGLENACGDKKKKIFLKSMRNKKIKICENISLIFLLILRK